MTALSIMDSAELTFNELDFTYEVRIPNHWTAEQRKDLDDCLLYVGLEVMDEGEALPEHDPETDTTLFFLAPINEGAR